MVRIHVPVQEREGRWVQSLGQEDPLEGGRATHSSIQRRIQYSEYAIFREVLRGVSSIWREPERLHEVTKNQTQLE